MCNRSHVLLAPGSFFFLFANGLQVAVTGAMLTLATNEVALQTVPIAVFCNADQETDWIAVGMKFEQNATIFLLLVWLGFQFYAARFMVKGTRRMKQQRQENVKVSEEHTRVRKASILEIEQTFRQGVVEQTDSGADNDDGDDTGNKKSPKKRLQQAARHIGEVALYQKRVLDEACVKSADD